MAKYVYVGEPGRYYVDFALSPEPGDLAELKANPGDGRWESYNPSDEKGTNPSPVDSPDVLAAKSAAKAAEDAAAKAESDLASLEAASNQEK